MKKAMVLMVLSAFIFSVVSGVLFYPSSAFAFNEDSASMNNVIDLGNVNGTSSSSHLDGKYVGICYEISETDQDDAGTFLSGERLWRETVVDGGTEISAIAWPWVHGRSSNVVFGSGGYKWTVPDPQPTPLRYFAGKQSICSAERDDLIAQAQNQAEKEKWTIAFSLMAQVIHKDPEDNNKLIVSNVLYPVPDDTYYEKQGWSHSFRSPVYPAICLHHHNVPRGGPVEVLTESANTDLYTLGGAGVLDIGPSYAGLKNGGTNDAVTWAKNTNVKKIFVQDRCGCAPGYTRVELGKPHTEIARALGINNVRATDTVGNVKPVAFPSGKEPGNYVTTNPIIPDFAFRVTTYSCVKN